MHRHVCMVMALTLLVLSGCNRKDDVDDDVGWEETLTSMQRRARSAGNLAASGYLVAYHPTPEQAKVVKKAVGLVSKNLKTYQRGGFAPMAAEIKKQVSDAFAKEHKNEVILAHALVDTLVDELDALFRRNPDWQTRGSEVASVIASFCDGAVQAMTNAGVRKVEGESVPAPDPTILPEPMLPRPETVKRSEIVPDAAPVVAETKAPAQLIIYTVPVFNKDNYRWVTLDGKPAVLLKDGETPPVGIPFVRESGFTTVCAQGR